MTLDELRHQVCEANRALPASGLVRLTWGNVSGIDHASGLWAIKPSGVDYDQLTPADIVVLDLEGKVVEGKLRPSSDTRGTCASSAIGPGSSWATAPWKRPRSQSKPAQ